jgi:hypothetical protein
MAARRESPDEAPAGLPGAFDLLGYLSHFFATPESHFVILSGAVGSGKSTLLRVLVPLIPGPKLFLAFAPSPGIEGTVTAAARPASLVSWLLVDPQHTDAEGGPSTPTGDPSSLLAFSPHDPGAGAEPPPPALVNAFLRLAATGPGTVVADSWDRGSEQYFRSHAKGPEAVETLSISPGAIGTLQGGIVSSTNRLLLALTPEMASPLLSAADAVLQLKEEAHAGSRVRVLTVAKIRGAPPPIRNLVYSLDGGRFRPYPALPPGFRIPVGASDDDPDPTSDSGWPGSAAFARAFGRLRFGGATAITLSRDCPDTVPLALTVPLATHVLRSGGRAVWILSPSIRPAKITKILREFVPAEWMQERFRILSASGDDPALGDLRTVVVPLVRPHIPSAEARPAPAPGVRPLFPEIYRFLQTRREGTPAVLLVSLDGLRAAVATAGVTTIDATTLPAILATYTRLPQFHAYGYGNADDPAAPYLRPVVDSLLQLEMVHGRPVISGLRPRTEALLLDWPVSDGRYQLVPVS